MPQQLDGRYEILKPLGSGGFGKTYLARDLRIPGRPQCVVKQLHCVSPKAEDKKLARELFQREAESLAQLGHHDQIPRLLAYFSENDEFYLVEEFIDGRSLEDEIKAGQPWPEAAVVRLVQSLLEVLSFVHAQGVIHRDIKPGNLIRRHRDGKIVLIDFGAIKQLGQVQRSVLHHTGTQIGTAGYMPPEQAQGKPRPNSDIYGVGMVAISALTGHPAISLPDDPQTGEVVWQHLATVSPGFAQILTRMVRYYFQHRYQTIAEVQTALNHLPVSSAPASAATPRPTFSPTESTQVADPAVASSPAIASQTQSRAIPWVLGIGLAIFIPVLGGAAAFLFNARNSFTNSTDSLEPVADQPCTAVVVGNIRSERTAYRGNGNILQTGQGRSFEIGTEETRGGWIQIKLPSGQIAWTHLDVVANESALKSCLSEKNIALKLIADIPPPPRPQPRPPAPPVTRPSTEPAPTEEVSPSDDPPVAEDDNSDSTTSSDSTQGTTRAPEDNVNGPNDTPHDSTQETQEIEESQLPESTAPPSESESEPIRQPQNDAADNPSAPAVP